MTPTWPRIKLGDCVDLLAGFTFKSQDFSDQASDIPLVKGENVGQGEVLWDIAKRWRAADWERLEKFQLSAGDIVVAMDRPWVPAGLKWAYIRATDPKALLVQRVARLRSKDVRLDQTFLRFVIGSPFFEDYIRPITSGVNVPHISGRQILDFDFILPPVPVQRRIASILSAYDQLIENNQRRIKILEEMARALYREWFVEFRFPGHEKVQRVALELGRVPRGWAINAVSEAADVFRGRSYGSTDLANEGGLPFVNLKCIDRDGGFRRSGLKRYTGDYKDSHLVRKGDIVMGVTDMTQDRRVVARAALVPTLDKECGVFSMDLVRIEPKPSVPKAFLYCFFRFSDFADKIKQHANGANVLHLSPDRISTFRFTIPPENLMSMFVDFASPTLELVDALENQIANLRHTRDALLRHLLSGRGRNSS